MPPPGPRRQLDDADHPAKRALGILAQHPHSPRLDPFVRMLLTDLDHARLAALGKGSHAAARLKTRCFRDRRKNPIARSSRSVLVTRGQSSRGDDSSSQRNSNVEHPARVAVRQPGVDRQIARLAVQQGLDVAEHRPGVEVTILGLLAKGSLDQPLDRVADARNDAPTGAAEVRCSAAKHKLIPGLGRERGPAGQKMKQRRAHRINIGPGIDGTPGPLLGSHVVGCSQQGAGRGQGQRFGIDDVPGQSEVRDLDPRPGRFAVQGRDHGRIERHRRRGRFAGSARGRSRRSRRTTRFRRHRGASVLCGSRRRMLLGLISRCTIPRSWASIKPRATAAMNARASLSSSRVRRCQQLAQALAGHEFQDHVRDAVVLVEFEQVDDVRIVGLGHEPGLLAEPPEDLGVVDRGRSARS